MLPPLHKKVFQERLLGLYFIKDFMGSGMTDCVLDDNGNFYFIMLFNPETLDYPFGMWVTLKDESCFIPDETGHKAVFTESVQYMSNNSLVSISQKSVRYFGNHFEIIVSGEYSAFFYALLHEGTHGVDYVKNITPYIEDMYVKIHSYFNKPLGGIVSFTNGVWQQINQPVPKYNFPLRDKITVFGWNGGPKIFMKDMNNVYRALFKTPFVTLYGSKTWTEDLAEFVTYYHLTQKLGCTYKITVKSNDKTIISYSPMTNELVKARFDSIQIFYQ